MDSKRYAGEQLLSAWLTLSSTLWNERVVTGMTFNEAFVCNLLTHQAKEAPDRPHMEETVRMRPCFRETIWR